jgi:hypothetical protein
VPYPIMKGQKEKKLNLQPKSKTSLEILKELLFNSEKVNLYPKVIER